MKAGVNPQASEQTRAMTEAVEGLLVSCEGILAQASSAPSAVRPIVKRPLCPDALQQRAASHAPAAAGGLRLAGASAVAGRKTGVLLGNAAADREQFARGGGRQQLARAEPAHRRADQRIARRRQRTATGADTTGDRDI